MISKQELIDFEEDIADCFNKKMIRAPIHLFQGGEDQHLEIAKNIKDDSWLLSTWRSHHVCLLKVPKDELKKKILEGKSIGLCFQRYKIICSGIVGGIFPIAVGLGLAIKRKQNNEKVWVFAGEMSYFTGIAYECMRYATNFKLPIEWVCEDNGKSVCTPSYEVVGETWIRPE